MAVYTDVSADELDAILGDYSVGVALSCKGIAEGVENSNFLLETDQGRFILTIYEKRVDEADLPFFMNVMEALADAGVPAPRPIRRRDGGVLSRVRGKPAALIAFLQGLSARRPSAAQCRAIGRALAQMHLALAGFAGRRRNALGSNAWAVLITPRVALAERLRPGLAGLISGDLENVAGAWPRDLPEGVIHADLFPDNALFIGETVSGVIDFYFACTDALAYDLAVCLNAWCFEDGRSFNLTKGAHLIAGYQSLRALSPGEIAALPVLARGAAMRFFATRLADWGEQPPGAVVRPKDPLEYADRLDFHRGAKSAADYGLRQA